MNKIVPYASLALGILLLAPLATHAASNMFLTPGWSLVPEACRACPCGWGGIFQIVQNVINIGIDLAILLFTLLLSYAGILWITNPASPENKSKANALLMNAVVGMVIILAAWLIVDFVMKSLYDPAGSKFGPWNSIIVNNGDGASSCIVASHNVKPLFSGPTVGVASVPQARDLSGNVGPSGTVGDGSIPSKICASASAYKGHSTAACGCGDSACAWAVNEVLKGAGFSSIGGQSVDAMESGLHGGRGSSISQSAATCGDIVMVHAGGRNHVGICLNTGCTQAISNSSTNQSFSWVSPQTAGDGPIFKESYSTSAPRTFYRVTN